MAFNIWIGILAFLFVYNVPIAFLPISSSKIVVIILLVWSTFKGEIRIGKKSIKPVIWIIILIFYSFIVAILNSSGDYSLIYSEILFVINHTMGSLLFANVLYHYKKLSIRYILKMLVYIAVVQAIIIILMIVSASFYSIVANLSPLATRNSIYLRYGGARGYGLAQSITYDLAVVQSFALLFIVYLFPELRKNEPKLFTIYYLLICFSITVTGRTAFIGILLSILLKIVYTNKLSKRGVNRVVTTFGVGVIALSIGVNYLQNTSFYSNLIKYIFEFRISGGIASTSTGSNIIKMFDTFKTITWKSFIFGDGRYKGEGVYYYMNVDVGFFRQIYYFGMIGLVILLIAYWSIYKTTIRNVLDNRFKKMWVLFFIYVLIANIKGDFILGCGMAICEILLIYFASYSHKRLVENG